MRTNPRSRKSRRIKKQVKNLRSTARARVPTPHRNTKDISLSITTFIIISLIKSVALIFVLMTAAAYSVWLERKVSAHIQNRWGPTRVGPFGLLQPLADGVKFIFKEDLTQPHVYPPLD